MRHVFFRAVLAFFALFAAVFAGPAKAEPVDGGHAVVELIADHSTVKPGQTFQAALSLKLDKGWHVYWLNAGDAGLPPELRVSDASDIPASNLGGFIWPVPKLLPVVAGEIMDYGYDDEVVLAFPVKVPETNANEITLRATADYLICEEICIPETAEVALTLVVGTPLENLATGAQIANWVAKAPVDWPGEARFDAGDARWTLSLKGGAGDVKAARFFPLDHVIEHPADQPAELGAEGLSLTLSPSGKVPETLGGVVALDMADGTRQGFTIAAPQGAPFAGTSGTKLVAASAPASVVLPPVKTPGLPMLLLFALLGGLVLNLMPCVLPVLSMKALGMVHAAASGKAGEVRAHGIWYTAGVLVAFGALAAVIIGVRAATQESLTLGFQLQSPPAVALLALLMFAIGLWLMGFFELGTSVQNTGDALARKGGAMGAFFTGVLAAVVGAPCVGPFLSAALGAVMTQPAFNVAAVFLTMGFGLALPFLVLSFVPGLQRLLPKPGRWMETLKQAFAFPMFLTAAWLLSVLGALAGPGAIGWTLAGAVAIAFAVWIGRRGSVARIVAVLAVAGGALLAAVQSSQPVASAASPGAYSATYPVETWSPERLAEVRAEGRPVFVDFTAAWCATCQVNKATTLKSKAVLSAFEKADVAFLVADFTRRDAVIAAELKAHGRAGVPLYLWYPSGATSPEILPEMLSPERVIALTQN